MSKHLYLLPPTFFWRIPKTDVMLTRGEPYMKIEDDVFDNLVEDEAAAEKMKEECWAILGRSLANGTIAEVAESFIPEDKTKIDLKYMLSEPADVIQRKFLSRMSKPVDIPMLEALLSMESESRAPRKALINLLRTKIDIIKVGNKSRVENSLLPDLELELDDEPRAFRTRGAN